MSVNPYFEALPAVCPHGCFFWRHEDTSAQNIHCAICTDQFPPPPKKEKKEWSPEPTDPKPESGVLAQPEQPAVEPQEEPVPGEQEYPDISLQECS